MSHDTLIHSLVRSSVGRIAHTGITPNHITTARFATGLAAAAMFALGPGFWMAAGGAVFVISMLLDRADGELARQTGRSSRFGYWYDIVSDCLAGVAAFVGLGIGLAHSEGPLAYFLGALAGLGIGALFFQLFVQNVATVGGMRLFGGRFNVDPDDALILVPILVWCGLAYPMLIAAAVTAPALAVAFAAAKLFRTRSRTNLELGRE